MYITTRLHHEQVRYFREQTPAMRCVPFDFEIERAERSAARVDMIIGWVGAIGFVALLTCGWIW